VALSDQGRAALTYWAQIQQAAARRENTAGAFERINADREAAGETGPGPSMLGVGEVYSVAVQVRNATEALGQARDTAESTGIDQAITRDMVALDISAGPTDVITTFSNYYVRMQAEFTTPLGASVTQFITAKYDAGTLPATVTDLMDALNTWAPSQYASSALSFESIGDISITAH
jgi:hypothetical protein